MGCRLATVVAFSAPASAGRLQGLKGGVFVTVVGPGAERPGRKLHCPRPSSLAQEDARAPLADPCGSIAFLFGSHVSAASWKDTGADVAPVSWIGDAGGSEGEVGISLPESHPTR